MPPGEVESVQTKVGCEHQVFLKTTKTTGEFERCSSWCRILATLYISGSESLHQLTMSQHLKSLVTAIAQNRFIERVYDRYAIQVAL